MYVCACETCILKGGKSVWRTVAKHCWLLGGGGGGDRFAVSDGIWGFTSIFIRARVPPGWIFIFWSFFTFCSHIYKHINEHKGILSKRQCSYKDFLVKNLVNVFKNVTYYSLKKAEHKHPFGSFRVNNWRMTHLSRLPLQSSRKAAEYLAEEQTEGKPALSPAFPGMITVLYTAGESLTVCWLPSACLKIFSSVFCTGMCDF